MVFLKKCFEKIDFEKNQQPTKKHAKLPSRQGVLELWNDANLRNFDSMLSVPNVIKNYNVRPRKPIAWFRLYWVVLLFATKHC